LNFENKKNRSWRPFGKVEKVDLFFDKGINPLGGLLTSLRYAERIVGPSNWTVQEPWANGETVKFKAALEADMPEEILLRCPSLIDAKDEREVKEYLDTWRGAIDLSEEKMAVEAVKDENVDAIKQTDIIAELGLESEFDDSTYSPEDEVAETKSD
jgi:hypothetical protein